MQIVSRLKNLDSLNYLTGVILFKIIRCIHICAVTGLFFH